MYRPSQNHVIASERIPAQFRPSNQALLVPSASANRCNSETADYSGDTGIVRKANGKGDNGLSPERTLKRFQSALNVVEADRRQKMQQIHDAGIPTALPGSKIFYTDFQGAAAIMPAAPGSGKKLVSRMPRGDGAAWEVFTWNKWGRPVFEATLRKEGQPVLESGAMSTETDARNYILAQQFARTNVKDIQPVMGAGFQREVMQATSPYANAAGALVRRSLVVRDDDGEVYVSKQPLPIDGITTTTALSLGTLVVGAAALFVIFRR